MAEIPDDTGLKAALRGILNEADLEQLTKRAARRQLEKKLDLAEGALDHRKQDIGEWVDHVMAEKEAQEAEEPDVKEEDDDSSEDAAPAKKEKKKGGGGFGEAYLKPALQEFTGLEKCARSHVVKLIWEHVKGNGLQDEKDKRYIVIDDRLRPLFPSKKRIHMFAMNKELTKHFGERVATGGSKKKAKKESEDEDDDDDDEEEEDDDDDEDDDDERPKKRRAAAASKPAKKRKGGGGFAAPVKLSAELASLLHGVDTMPRTQVVKELWAYIKANDRQDPENRKWIIPDSKMRPVFGDDKFTGFSMMKILKPHIFKIE